MSDGIKRMHDTGHAPMPKYQLVVYVVVGTIQYECSTIEGVYIDRGAAESRLDEVRRMKSEISKTLKYDYAEIETHDVHGAKGWV